MGVCLRFLANIFLLLFLCSNKSYVYGVRELADHHHAEDSLMPPPTCSPTTQGLQIARIDGPCSPLGQENPRPRSREILLQDQSRVRALNSISSSSDDYSGQGTSLTLQKKEDNDNYFVNVGFGTPTVELTLMFDTGSSLTWIQCFPCDGCYKQEDPKYYQPLGSSTFSNASCIYNPNTCNYIQSYYDQSHSQGYFVKDTLTISNVQFSEFKFGCGQYNSDNFGGAAGLLGLGLYDTSLMSQTDGHFGKMFCYCLPSGGSNGYVVFGNKAREMCSPQYGIQLLKATKDGYFVSLVGITIGPQRINVSSNSGLSTSAMIDSGTPISRLPPSVYSQLNSTFRALMSDLYHAEPVRLDDVLGTCYDLESHDKKYIPSMTLHFDGSVDLHLGPSAVYQDTNNSGARLTCLAFASNTDDNDSTIIGSHQLQNIKIFFDINEATVGLSSGCSN